MIPLPLAVVSATPATTTVIAADNGAKRAEAGDDFAALLGIQVAVAAGEAKPGPAIAHAPLPKGGKTLPDPADAAPETVEPATPEVPATEEAAPLPQPEVSTLTTAAFALAVAAAIAPVAAEAATVAVTVAVTVAARPIAANAPISTAPLIPSGSKPAILPAVRPEDKTRVPQVQAKAPSGDTEILPAVRPEDKTRVPQAQAKAPSGVTEIPPKPNDDTAEKPAPARPNAVPQVSLPAQAAARAVLIHGLEPALIVDPIKPAPVLPEKAAAQATIALAARSNPERPARLPEAVAAVASPPAAEPVSALPLAPLRPVKDALAERAPFADLPPALAAVPARGDPQTAAPAPAAPPTLARHDFAAMIDRLFEARDMAGSQPVAITLRHDDFGAVSLAFRTADDGLTVTMASPDPDFARAVNAAAATGAASNQSDPGRQGGEPASSRSHGGNAAGEDMSGQSRAGSRSSERDPSRQRGEPSQARPSTPRQHGRSGIFA